MKFQQVMALASAAAVLGLAGAVSAQKQAPREAHAANGLSALDKTFLKDTAQSNLEEIQVKALVLKRAKKFATKDYAQHLARDHARANRSLSALAVRKGVTLPSEISKEQRAILQRLSGKPASLFDAAYKHEMIRDHRQGIAGARREVSLGHDRDVRTYAQSQIALLQMHLGLAYSLPGYTAHRPGTGIGSR